MGKRKEIATKGEALEKDGESEQTASMGSYFRLFSYITGKDRIALALALLCSIASGVPLPLMNIIFGNLVGEFQRYFMPDTQVTEGEFKASVNKLSLYIVYLFIAKFVLTYVSMFSFRVIGLRVSSSVRLHYMQSLFAQPISKLDEVSVGTVTNTITTLSNTIQQSISDKLAILFQSLALLITAYVIAFKYSWALTLVTSSSLLFILICCMFIMPAMTKIQQQVDKADEQHSSISAEVLSSIRTVLSLGAEETLATKYASWVEESRKRGQKMSIVLGLHLCLMFFAMYASYALAFWFGLKLYREGHIADINTVVIVFFSVMMVVSVLGGIASPLIIISKATSAASSFFEMIDLETINRGGLKDPEASSDVDITLQKVHFAYPTRPDIPILKGFNARFQQGKTTALVGPSGSGKSTIVGLLERWFELGTMKGAHQGNIFAGAHNLTGLDLKWWRSQIGLVQQNPFLFDDTIFNNVAFGLVGTKWEHETHEVKQKLVEKACEQAFADEYIKRLPEGYETLVGESGKTLSGGQKQRLAIARSIVKEPSILILDEATSAIDVHGEKIVQKALDQLSKDRTTIVIAHRLSTIRKADHIIVLKDGVDVEQGTHDDLLEIENGVYRGLVSAQSLAHLTDDGPDGSEGFDALEKEASTVQAFHEPEKEEKPQTSYKNKGFFRSIGLILYEQRAHWPFYSLTFLGAAGAGSSYALQSWLFAHIIEVFGYQGQRLTDAANFWALMFFVLALGVALCYFPVGFSSNTFSMKVSSFYREQYFRNILRKPIPFYDLNENASGSLVSRLSTDPKQIQDLLGANGAFPLISIFNILGCIIIAFTFGWKLSLVAVFAAMPFVLLAAFMRIRFELQFEAMNAEVYSGSSQFAAEAISAFRTVSALVMEDAILGRYLGLLQTQRKRACRKAWYATLIFAFSDSVELCAMALTFWYGGQLLASREYEPSTFFVIYMATIQSSQSAGQFLSFGPNIAQAVGSANRMLSYRPTSAPRDNLKQLTPSEYQSAASVELRNVTFKYPSREVPLFTGLNLNIKSGQFVAFVGPSGCGKTSVISLLERFYDPAQGAILVNEQDITSIGISSYRKALALVTQEPRLFNGTIKENITLGLGDKGITDGELTQACKDAEIHDFIASLPDGYGTALGTSAQTALSGGQQQRLCIARALVRKPSLLLLDEATSSLDSQSEKLVQSALERLAGRRETTIIAVAHRLATIQKADAIFVFGESHSGKGSRIVEQGTHGELLRRKGGYWHMMSFVRVCSLIDFADLLQCQEQALDR